MAIEKTWDVDDENADDAATIPALREPPSDEEVDEFVDALTKDSDLEADVESRKERMRDLYDEVKNEEPDRD